MKIIQMICIALLFISCATVSEITSPTDSSLNYTETKNEVGELIEECKKFLNACYSEVGIRYKALTGFYRLYSISEADVKLPVKHLWGVDLNF